jgi:tetratricopeptide (TPR) repeat protein
MSEFEFWKDLGNIFDAILNYQKKNVEFNTRFINPWIRLGNVFDRQDQHNEAVQAYQHATEIDPDSAQNWINLGDAHFKNGTYDEAAISYQNAINLDPQSGWPLSNLAMVLVTQGKYQEAIPLYTASISLLTEDKDKAISWNRLGNVYRKLNDYENAFLAFQRADELDSENTGFSDKLDEEPSTLAVVAPEEILEQLIVEQQIDAAELSAVAEETDLSEVEMQVVEEPLVALAPNMEMIVEEEAVAEETAEIAAEAATEEVAEPVEEAIEVAAETAVEEVLEDVTDPAIEEVVEVDSAVEVVEEPVAEEALQEEETEVFAESAPEVITEEVVEIAVEAAAEEVTEEVVTEAIAEETVEVSAEAAVEDTAEVEVEAAAAVEEEVAEPKSAVLQLIEDVIARVEAAAGFNPDKEAEEAVQEEVTAEAETSRIPSWLIINDKAMIENAIAEGEKLVEAHEMESEVSAIDSVTTISDVPQQVAVSESAINMDIVETYTEPVVTQLSEEVAVSEETVEVPAEQAGAESESSLEEEQVLEVEEVFTQAEITLSEEVIAMEESSDEMTEAAYEEYLKDVVEPSKILADHVDEISEAPETKVGPDGEIRIAMDTKNAHVWNELGNVYLNAGSYDDAIASYGKALELDRHFAWPYSNLALAYVQKGRFAEAILLYQRGIELFTSDKDKAVTWNRLGNVYRRMNDYDNAIAAYQTADELDPENATLSLRSNFGLLGNIYNEQKPAYIA